MINNISFVYHYLNFEERDNRFLHCQIIRRAKDHRGPKAVKGGLLRTYLIRSRDHLQKIMPEIIMLCEHYGARAYINLASKSIEKLRKLMLVKLSSDIYFNCVRNPEKILYSAAGELKPEEPKWIIDIDNLEDEVPVRERLYDISFKGSKFEYEYIYDTIPTVNGIHIITKPFNLTEFKEHFPNIDVHKNSAGTLLYYPETLSKKKRRSKYFINKERHYLSLFFS